MNRREQDAHEDLCRRLVTALNERDAARAEVAAVRGLADEWDRTVFKLPPGYPMSVNEFCRYWFKAPLRAALGGTP